MNQNKPVERQPSLKRRLIIMLLLVGILLGGLVAFNQFKANAIKSYMASQTEPAQTVTATVAEVTAWSPALEEIASLRAVRGVDLGFEVSGIVKGRHFKSGEMVHAGQLLVELNDESEKAQVAVLAASVKLARITLERDQAQLAAKAISQAQVDNDRADLDSKLAQLQQQKALLQKKSLVAPFEGRAGITTVNPGQYLNPGDKVVTLQQIVPILVDFHVPQQWVADIKVGEALEFTTDAWPGKAFKGVVSALNPLVDGNTRNLAVEARLDNPGQALLPGMFGRVRVTHGTAKNLVTLPQTAITYNPYGSSVFVLKAPPAGKTLPQGATLVAAQVFVTLGGNRGDQVAVLSGVNVGDTVVTSGGLKLKNGTPVVVTTQVTPPNNPAPTPQEK
jgi:membrane fusion protein (multidrug efflux system)